MKIERAVLQAGQATLPLGCSLLEVTVEDEGLVVYYEDNGHYFHYSFETYVVLQCGEVPEGGRYLRTIKTDLGVHHVYDVSELKPASAWADKVRAELLAHNIPSEYGKAEGTVKTSKGIYNVLHDAYVILTEKTQNGTGFKSFLNHHSTEKEV